VRDAGSARQRKQANATVCHAGDGREDRVRQHRKLKERGPDPKKERHKGNKIKAIIKKGRYSLLIIPAPALGRDDHKTASGTASEDEEGRESASVSLVGWLAGWLVGWLVWLVGSFSISRRCLSSNPECENQMPGTCVSVYACVRAVCEKPSPTKSQPRAIQS
jgi:hypothetical protein